MRALVHDHVASNTAEYRGSVPQSQQSGLESSRPMAGPSQFITGTDQLKLL